MEVKDFDYELPEELIAQNPLLDRSSSKMLVCNKVTGKLVHKHFFDIIDYLTPNDVLVMNDTKVMPSRLFGYKTDTNAKIELLLLKEVSPDCYEALVKPARRINIGTVINFSNIMTGQITSKFEDGICHIKFAYEGIFLENLDKLGEMPLPPYIHEKLKDNNRYQTIYAKDYGSSAAPTAGLHFTEDLLAKIKAKGVQIEYVTLNIGLGTFRPVSVDEITKHQMHSELFKMTEQTAKRLNKAKEDGKRIISVGTTSMRTLEAIYTKYNKFIEVAEETNIFIYPGYEFKIVDALITNFHLPKSTLVMLVSAFSSREIILNAYRVAIDNKYRFFSFGDSMFLYDK